MNRRRGFTMAELLIVLGVLLIIWFVLLYLLNPSQLFYQGNDGNRVSGLSSLDKAISLYYSNAINSPTTLFMGTSSVAYISIPDPTATTTAGTNCSGIGFVYTGVTFHCAASSTYTRTDGTGWIPINFNSYPGGNPLSSLPVDPINNTSSGEYYAYMTDGNGGYEIIGVAQSTKDASDTTDFIKGTNVALMPTLPNGIVIAYATTSIPVGTHYAGITFDSHTNTIWTVNPTNGLVMQINDTTYATSTYAIPSAGSVGITFDSHNNTVWVSGASSNVIKFNDTTYATTSYSLGVTALNLTFDSNNNTIWASNGNSANDVERINETTGTSTAYSVGNYPYSVAFDSNTNTVWATNYTDNTVTQVNDTTGATTTYGLGAGAGPVGITFDSHTNTLWAVDETTNAVTQINDTTYATTSYSVGTNPYYDVFDPHSNSIWVPLNSGSNSVTRVNDITFATSTYTGGNSPEYVAYDSHTNAIWVVNANSGNILVLTPSR